MIQKNDPKKNKYLFLTKTKRMIQEINYLFLTKNPYKGGFAPPGREAPYIQEFLSNTNIFISYKIQEKSPKNKSPKKEYLFSYRNPREISQTQNIFVSYKNPYKGASPPGAKRPISKRFYHKSTICFLSKFEEKSLKHKIYLCLTKTKRMIQEINYLFSYKTKTKEKQKESPKKEIIFTIKNISNTIQSNISKKYSNNDILLISR